MSLPLRGPRPGEPPRTALPIQALFDTAPPAAAPPPPPPPSRPPSWEEEEEEDAAAIAAAAEGGEEEEEEEDDSGESLMQVFLSDDHQDVLWALLSDADANESDADAFLNDVHVFAGTHIIFRVGRGGITPFSWEALEIADLCFLSERYGKKKHA